MFCKPSRPRTTSRTAPDTFLLKWSSYAYAYRREAGYPYANQLWNMPEENQAALEQGLDMLRSLAHIAGAQNR